MFRQKLYDRPGQLEDTFEAAIISGQCELQQLIF